MNKKAIAAVFSLVTLLMPGMSIPVHAAPKTVTVDGDVQYRLIGNAGNVGTDGAPAPDGPPAYRVSVDGGKTYGRAKRQDPMVRLRNDAFDPVMQDEARPAVGNNYLVQLEIQPLAAVKRRIMEAGGEVIGFVPPQTYLVRAETEAMKAIEGLPFVRWTGPYAPAYKTPAALRATLQSDAAMPPARYVISLFSDAENDVNTVAGQIGRLGGNVVMRSKVSSRFLQAELTARQLSRLLEHDEVQYVEPWMPPESDLDIVREVGGANAIEAAVPYYTGEGVTGEVLDDAIWPTHQGFTAPRIHGTSDIDDAHGTPVYGIVFGNGGADPQARALLPDGDGVFASWVDMTDRAAHTAELVDPDGEYRAVFQTNSWGNGRTTEYNSFSAEMDQIIFDADLLITQSQSNAGDRQSRPQAWAKNIVSVGGIRHRNTADFSDDAWSSGASIGPAADGRIKPDLAHFYDSVWTTSGADDTAHRNFGGTSASTPVTAGLFGLVFRMWADGVFTGEGTPGSGGDVFAARPHASTARALVINTAQQYAFSGIDHDLTRVHQGWGLADADALYSLAENNGWDLPLVVDEQHPLVDQQTQHYTLDVSAGQTLPWLKATMVYMDPAGNPAAEIATVNDLTLKLVAPDGTVYWGNAGLLEGNWSVEGGSPSTVDTVENIFIEQAQAGEWTLEVIADRLVSDARPETPEIDADYALVVTCAGENRCSGEHTQSNIPPEVAIVSPVEGDGFAVDEDVTLTAEASDPDGQVADVEFFVDGVSAGADTTAPYSVVWNAAAAGEKVLTAVATDDNNTTEMSEPVTIQVNEPGPEIACEYSVGDEWNTGFVATVRIANNSEAVVDGWQVQWEYTDGSGVTNYWSAQLSGDNPYTATPMSWNSTIEPGQAVEFGLQGVKGVSNSAAPVPALGGSSCE
jgi:hypothetical protein